MQPENAITVTSILKVGTQNTKTQNTKYSVLNLATKKWPGLLRDSGKKEMIFYVTSKTQRRLGSEKPAEKVVETEFCGG